MMIANAAVQGIHNAESSLDSAANNIAAQTRVSSPASDHVSLSADIVALIQAKNELAANINSFHAADEIERTVLNIVG
jgi:hypothetical protein